MSTVVVTGGAGFVGSHVAELFRDRGHEVTVVDDLSSGKRENIPEGGAGERDRVREGARP
jgi:UDP-glucose 4-epimerase